MKKKKTRKENLQPDPPARILPMGMRIFAFDFDGVITRYKSWVDYQKHKVDPGPNMEVIKAIRMLSKKGHTIIIHSTHSEKFLKKYCNKHKIPFGSINENKFIKGRNTGKPVASVYIDDRGYNYHGQKASQLVRELVKFQPYWGRKK